MAVSRFCDAQSILALSAGVFTRCQAKKRSVMLCIREPLKIPGLNNNRERRVGFDTDIGITRLILSRYAVLP